MFCHIVCACGFCAEDERARLNVEIGIFLYAQIQIENVERVEQLTFVFVKSLHLHVEDAVGINLNVVLSKNVFCKVFLVCTLDLSKTGEHLLVSDIILKFLKRIGFFEPLVADKFVDKVCKSRICLSDPSSVRDAVCNVGELLGVHAIVVRKNVVFKNIAMKCTDTVYGVRSDKAEICHFHLPV